MNLKLLNNKNKNFEKENTPPHIAIKKQEENKQSFFNISFNNSFNTHDSQNNDKNEFSNSNKNIII